MDKIKTHIRNKNGNGIRTIAREIERTLFHHEDFGAGNQICETEGRKLLPSYAKRPPILFIGMLVVGVSSRL